MQSEVLLINGDDEKRLLYADLFNCQMGNFPIRYLGVPVSPSRLHVRDWTPLLEKNEKNWLFGKVAPCPLLGGPP